MGSHTVLVTGGAGFLGSYVVRDLADAGCEPVVLDIGDYRPEARFVIGDAVESIPFERTSIDNWPRVVETFLRHRPTTVVHVGGIMDDAYLSAHPTVALQTNVGGAMNLLEASRLTGVQRFVFVSSIAVIGQVMYEPIDANHPLVTARRGPLGAYGAAKAAIESFCFSHEQAFGLEARIVRPSAVYGFGMSWYAPNYMKNVVEPALEGIPVRLATGGQVPRDYTSAVDVASLVTKIVQGPADADRIFYGATGRPLSKAADVARIVRELVPGADVSIGDGMTDVDRGELPLRGRYSVANAQEQLGWTPRLADLREGIVEYIERLRAFTDAGGTPTPMPAGLHGAPGQGG